MQNLKNREKSRWLKKWNKILWIYNVFVIFTMIFWCPDISEYSFEKVFIRWIVLAMSITLVIIGITTYSHIKGNDYIKKFIFVIALQIVRPLIALIALESIPNGLDGAGMRYAILVMPAVMIGFFISIYPILYIARMGKKLSPYG
jgi:hypothetical protein